MAARHGNKEAGRNPSISFKMCRNRLPGTAALGKWKVLDETRSDGHCDSEGYDFIVGKQAKTVGVTRQEALWRGLRGRG